MKFKKFDVTKIAQNLCTDGIVQEYYLPTLKPDLVSKCVTIDVVVGLNHYYINGEWIEKKVKEKYAIVVVKVSTFRNRHKIMPKCDVWFPETIFPSAQLWRLTDEGWILEDSNHWDFLRHCDFFKTIVSDNQHQLTSVY